MFNISCLFFVVIFDGKYKYSTKVGPRKKIPGYNCYDWLESIKVKENNISEKKGFVLLII